MRFAVIFFGAGDILVNAVMDISTRRIAQTALAFVAIGGIGAAAASDH